jgi:predicted DNA-binding protein (UPF0251 family)
MDGLEALRLADYKGLSHETAAEHMGVSRQTFGRILSEAHYQIARALTMGHALRIHGGHYTITSEQTLSQNDVQGNFSPEFSAKIETENT